MSKKKEHLKPEDDPNYVAPHGDNRAHEASGNIERLKRETQEAITKIRADADAMENDRRIQEEVQRNERFHDINKEVQISFSKNIGIDFVWQELDDREDCEQLAKEIDEQKKKCQEILDSKDTLIRSFQEQLKQKDEDYVKSLKRQSKDIDRLIENMRSQYERLRAEMSEELLEIEASFTKEREEILTKNRAEIEALFEKHKDHEEQYLEKRADLEEQHQNELDDLRKQEAYAQQQQKIKLESEMQILQKCMEDMKAVYILNEEKLDFNLKVLYERQKVNATMIESLKKKLQRQNDSFRAVDAKMRDDEAKYRAQNVLYTKQYKRVTEQFKELQEKYRRFVKSDQNRFDMIWQMNEFEVRELIAKIVDADKVIHVQQLGIPWTPPHNPIFGYVEGKAGGTSSHLNANTSIAESSRQGASQSKMEEDKSQVTGKDGQYESQVPITKIKKVFKILVDEMPFLVDKKTWKNLEGKSEKEQFTMKIDAVRKSLEISTMEDVELLVETFYEWSRMKKAEKEADMMGEGEEDEEEDMKMEGESQKSRKQGGPGSDLGSPPDYDEDGEEILLIEEDDLTQILRQFQSNREERMNNADYMGNVKNQKRSNFESEEQLKERKKKKEKQLWKDMKTVLSDPKLQLWKALEQGLTKYYELLMQRKNLIDETGNLNQQGQELKTLMNQYLQAGVNHELKVPPTETMKLDQ